MPASQHNIGVEAKGDIDRVGADMAVGIVPLALVGRGDPGQYAPFGLGCDAPHQDVVRCQPARSGLSGRPGQDEAILADQGRRMGARWGSLLEEAAEILGVERDMDDAVEVTVRGRAALADRERRPAGCLTLESRADVSAGITSAL